MFKINRKLSVYISIGLTALTLLGLIALAFYLPTFTDYLISLPDNTGERNSLSDGERELILAECYVVLALALIAVCLLFFLLLLVKKGQVFTAKAVSLIRYISWCILLAGAVFFALWFFFTLLIFFAFGLIFVGLCIRVVKNVIEEAVHIKEENDLTV